jgi:DNA (cytosine-5)-methyltransferase 1
VTEALAFASVFAGVGGFDLAFDEAGMTCTAQVEINPDRQRVLAHHWPDVPRGGDVRDAHGSDLGRPDVLVGGFPCKDISRGLARNKGLQGTRSGLYWEFHRLLDEHLRLVDESRPRWTVLENVPDLLRTNDGRDLAAVVLGLEQLGYGWAFRVVDGRYVGGAQRRPRILIVGHRGGDGAVAQSVLADREPSPGHLGVRPQPPAELGARGRRGAEPCGARVYRKSARPRAKADAGGYSTYVESDFFNTLTENDSRSNAMQTHLVLQQDDLGQERLRALTPVEWERLQGFPDRWTDVGIEDKARLAALGEALDVHLGRWLAGRLLEVDHLLGTDPSLLVPALPRPEMDTLW